MPREATGMIVESVIVEGIGCQNRFTKNETRISRIIANCFLICDDWRDECQKIFFASLCLGGEMSRNL
jgi:hypothetical protein